MLPRSLLALFAALALVAAACGDDDAAAPTTTTDATTTTTEPPTTITSTTAPHDDVPTAERPDGDPEPVAPVGEPSRSDQSSPGFPASGSPAFVTDIEVLQYETVDRVVFRFAEESPVLSWALEFVEPPVREQPSGREIDLGGSTFAALTITPASAVDLRGAEPVQTYRGPNRFLAPVEGGLAEVAATQNIESTYTWTFGLSEDAPIGVAVLSGDGEPPRVVVDVVRSGELGSETLVAAHDQGARDFRVVTYGSESGRCYELRLPTDAEPAPSAVTCDPPGDDLVVHVLRDGDLAVIVGVIGPGTDIVDIDLIADDGSAIAEDAEDFDLVEVGIDTRVFAPSVSPDLVSAVVALDRDRTEVARVEL